MADLFECEYCGERFPSFKQAERHEINCNLNEHPEFVTDDAEDVPAVAKNSHCFEAAPIHAVDDGSDGEWAKVEVAVRRERRGSDERCRNARRFRFSHLFSHLFTVGYPGQTATNHPNGK